MSVMAVIFSCPCIYLFFFLHVRQTGAKIVSGRVMTQIKLLCITFPKCLIFSLSNSFEILRQRLLYFDLFFHCGNPSRGQYLIKNKGERAVKGVMEEMKRRRDEAKNVMENIYI
jgi:hypothetical protein